MQKTSDLISQYVEFILNNLPEWNHSRAAADLSIAPQKQKFITLSNRISQTLDNDQQLQQLGKIIREIVPDNHICLFDSQKRQLIEKKRPGYPRDEYNLAYVFSQKLEELALHNVKRFKIQNNYPQWMVATANLKNKKVGIIAIPSFGGDIDVQHNARKQFIENLFIEKNRQEWDGIIFDFRGNTGGDAEIIKEIGERLSGKKLNYSDLCEYIKGNPKNKRQEKILADKRYARTETPQYPSSTQDKFHGKLYILQDNWNASAAEGAIYMLSQISGSQTIGETTSGTFAGGACVNIPFECGMLRIGTEYRERNKNGAQTKEKEGMPPDINVPSQEACNKAIEIIGVASQMQKKYFSELKRSRSL